MPKYRSNIILKNYLVCLPITEVRDQTNTDTLSQSQAHASCLGIKLFKSWADICSLVIPQFIFDILSNINFLNGFYIVTRHPKDLCVTRPQDIHYFIGSVQFE